MAGGEIHGGSLSSMLVEGADSTKLCASGERGVNRGEGKLSMSSAILGECGLLVFPDSLNTRAEGAGERFANGSSSRRSEGGEFPSVELTEVAEGLGIIGIAGGSTRVELEAAADCDRSLWQGGGGEELASTIIAA